MMKYVSPFRLGLSVLSLSFYSLTATAQDSSRTVYKPNRITLKPLDMQCQNLFFRDPMAYQGQYYGMGIAYERRIRAGSKWAYVLPLSVQRDFAPTFPMTAVFVYPGIKYYPIDRRVSYGIGLHALLGYSRMRDHFTESEYIGNDKYYTRYAGVLGLLNNQVSFSVSKSFRVGAEFGIGLAGVSFSQDFHVGANGTHREPWDLEGGIVPVQNYAITLSYDF